MALKIGLLTGIGIVLALLALWWIQPETSGGQALLALIVFAAVNGIGGLIWRAKT